MFKYYYVEVHGEVGGGGSYSALESRSREWIVTVTHLVGVTTPEGAIGCQASEGLTAGR
jgi:hypothetical protein